MILDRNRVPDVVRDLRTKGQIIGTINGSFDLLHAGHLHIIREAARLCDVLFVGLNSDRSIKSYKGPDRPIIHESFRAQMMAALRWVDYVVLFDESDPRQLLAEIKPDIHINGASTARTASRPGSFGKWRTPAPRGSR